MNQLPVQGMGVATSAAAAPLDEEVNVLVATENNDLVGFDINNPEEILSQVPITGLQEGEKINSLMFDPDFIGPPSDVVPILAVTDQGRFYNLDGATGVAAPFMVGREQLQVFIGEEFDAILDPSTSIVPNGLLSPAGFSKIGVIFATPTENISFDIARGFIKKSARFDELLVEAPPLPPCVVSIGLLRDSDDILNEFYFDKINCKFLQNNDGGPLFTTDNPVFKDFFARRPDLDKNNINFADLFDFDVGNNEIENVADFVIFVGSLFTRPPPDQLSGFDALKSEDETEHEIFFAT
ncbi:MAG: hypothetical protein L0229_08795, partial [Blastocatellia bacterium]|nr:hypothetical protein [Blastocatellia bacterium]